MVKIVSVKFKNGGKPYYFAPGNDKYEKGMGVIVETAKGLEYATVVQPEGEVEDSEIVSPLKPVVRIATKRDEEQVKRNEERRGEALKTAQEKIAARGLEMKLVDCEFAFDGSKVVFFFTSENRVDFRELIKDLSSAFHMRIELRQINIRDEIKMTGGLAPCGRECCCIGSISEPKKVSVKMAKNQGLSLNPSKISGLCGRLMCCLAYENDYYAEVCKKMPKVGTEADTPDGKGVVVNVNMLKMLIKVRIEKNDAVSYHEYSADQLSLTHGGVVVSKDESEDEEEELPEEEPRTEAEAPRREQREHGDRNGRKEGKHGRNDRDRNAHGKNGEKRENGNPRPENGGGKSGKNEPRREGNLNGQDRPEGERHEGKKRNRHRNRHPNANGGNPNANGANNGSANQSEGKNGGNGNSSEGKNGFKNGRHRNDRRRDERKNTDNQGN